MKREACVGLWGCGNMGRGLARALVATGEARLCTVYDVQIEAAETCAQEYGAQIARTEEELLAFSGLDGVIVAVPTYLHAPAAIRAAAAGLGIFLEKPMSLTTKDCEEIVAATQRHSVPLMVGHVLRYYEPYRTIYGWQREGRFGRFYGASIWRVTDGRRIQEGHWRALRSQSGGFLYEVGIHELDMLRCLFGAPRSVRALSRKELTMATEWEDLVTVQLDFCDGTATYEGGAGSHVGRYGFRLYAEGATLISDAAFDRTALHVYGPGGDEISIPEGMYSDERPVEAELRDWLAALRGEAEVPITGEEGMANVALVEAIYHSTETGEIIHVDEKGKER